MRVVRWFPLVLGLLAAVSLTLEHGFHVGGTLGVRLEVLDIAIAVLFGLELLIDLAVRRLRSLRTRWYEHVLLLLFLIAIGATEWLLPSTVLQELLTGIGVRSLARLYLILAQTYVFLGLLFRFLRGQERVLLASFKPERAIIGGFAFLVISGTLLLLLPRASADPANPIRWLDAIFTSTSAVCVTGLAVRDTGTAFSPFGQAIVLALFQVGGLGIVAFVGFLSFSSGKGFSVPQMVALREIVNAPTLGTVRRQIMVLVGTALAIETLGAALLYQRTAELPGGVLARVFWSLFHSVSAFCNAGFGLSSDSLVGFRGDWLVNLTVVGLIVVGGIGAPVVGDLVGLVRRKLRLRRHEEANPRLARLTVQTRIALSSTLALILLGMVGFLLLEGPTRVGSTTTERVLVPLFQSVTTRTAGFNTTDIGALRESTLLLVMALMVVGACPVSTGGGVKTVTVVVLLMTLRSMMTGRKVEAFGRSVPELVVRASISTFLLYLGVLATILFLLALSDPAIPLRDRTFEAISALSTVGLSTGITTSLSKAGQLVLCAAMFCGRVGPLTLAILVFRSGRGKRGYELPEEPIVLG